MDTRERAKRVRIYLKEDDALGLQTAPFAVLDWLRRERALGASVFRGLGGLGPAGLVSADMRPESAPPVVVEWIDAPERVERLLPGLKALVGRGLITVEDVEVALSKRPLRDLPETMRASQVMSRDVVSVSPGTPLHRVVELIEGKVYRAVPVVEDGRPVGIITSTDLVERGQLAARIELLGSLTPAVRAEMLQRLEREGKTAADVMTRAPICVAQDALLTDVADAMVHRRLKRLPVQDAAGQLVGMVSRLDLLRTVAQGFARGPDEARAVGLRSDLPLARVMRTEVPVVRPETPLGEVLQAVVSTPLNRAIVVDADRHVLGIVSDEEVLVRVTPALRPGALRALMHRLPFSQASRAEVELEQQARARNAADLMRTDVVTARESQPLKDVIEPMLKTRQRLIAVVDEQGKLVGALDRSDVLRGLSNEVN